MDIYTIANATIGPTVGPTSEPTPVYLGFIAAVVSVVFFGSNYVPVKKIESGDGLFFQWVLCSAIWLTGAVINIVMGSKDFYILAMLGGFLWACGNVMVVPIIKTVGLGQGILIWAQFNLLSGWASGRFGWFGLKPEVPPNVTLNYVGISLCILSSLMYVFIKSNAQLRVPPKEEPIFNVRNSREEEQDLLVPNVHVQRKDTVSQGTVDIMPEDQYWLERLSLTTRRILGVIMCVVSGTFYGLTFTPIIYIIDHNGQGESYEGASSNGLDYVFAHFTGILGTSTVFFIVYCIAMKNTPRVYPRAILPGVVSGIMWAIADAAWFVANDALSEAVSFPIITTGPAIIAALWGILLFREIRGCVNFSILAVAFSLGIAGSVITGVSKISDSNPANSTYTIF